MLIKKRLSLLEDSFARSRQTEEGEVTAGETFTSISPQCDSGKTLSSHATGLAGEKEPLGEVRAGEILSISHFTCF
ncbi:unnamed protein product [Arctogadus glacialis]